MPSERKVERDVLPASAAAVGVVDGRPRPPRLDLPGSLGVSRLATIGRVPSGPRSSIWLWSLCGVRAFPKLYVRSQNLILLAGSPLKAYGVNVMVLARTATSGARRRGGRRNRDQGQRGQCADRRNGPWRTANSDAQRRRDRTPSRPVGGGAILCQRPGMRARALPPRCGSALTACYSSPPAMSGTFGSAPSSSRSWRSSSASRSSMVASCRSRFIMSSR